MITTFLFYLYSVIAAIAFVAHVRETWQIDGQITINDVAEALLYGVLLIPVGLCFAVAESALYEQFSSVVLIKRRSE